MNFKTKQEYKRKYRKLQSIAWSLPILFVVMFIFLCFNSVKLPTLLLYVLLVIMGMSLILGAGINIISDLKYGRVLIQYKKNIIEYRIRRKYVMAMNCIKLGKFAKAEKIFYSIPPNHKLSTYLYLSLTHEFIHSGQDKLVRVGQKIIDGVIDKYDPEKLNIDDY